MVDKSIENVGMNLGSVEDYKKRIVWMVEKIEDERFLKAIYISLRDYAAEKGLN